MKIQNHIVRTLINLLVTLIVGAIYFYLRLPALNPQSGEFYSFLILLCVVYIVCSLFTSGMRSSGGGIRDYWQHLKAQCKAPLVLIGVIIIVTAVGALLSWQVIRANSYKHLLNVQQGDFAQEVNQISFDQIPMLDKDSAQRLGDRKLGELSDMVSQFEVADDYSQINLNNRPVRVTPLVYGDLIKWLNNRSAGIPAYLIIDMATQNVDVVRLTDGIKYSTAEHFGRNLYRHLRFQYPTYMFSFPTFEVDDNQTPYWICPKIVKRVGLFGGSDVDGAVLVNAITGESEYYKEVPTWVDRVYPADLIVEQYNFYGTYINGFWNSVFGQKGVTHTTSGYNYIAQNDDVYMYTGITSAGSDQSNVGFILTNQRTKQTTYYPCAGATEYSAIASAEGVVQHLKYKATFPLLLNVADQPTYFMSLKDNAQLVKMYAMVNVQQYQVVATGSTIQECQRQYEQLLLQNNIAEKPVTIQNSITGTIADIRTAVKNGNSYYYIKLSEGDTYYVIAAADNELVVTLNTGDSVTIEYDTASDGAIRHAYSIKRE